MMTVKYGETVATEEVLIYEVRTNWPRHDNFAGGNDKSVGYATGAYTDKRNPGSTKKFRDTQHQFSHINADVCDVPSRVERSSGFTFSEPAAALACADRLREFGELSCHYEGPEDWRERDKGMSLTVRIVEIRSARIERVVESCS